MAVLASDQIRRRLMDGEIFVPGTWDDGSIRGASYDLRIASDFMRIPGPDGKYARGMDRGEPIKLREGEVALFSSRERLCLPRDLTASIGIKFSYSRKGLIILSGLLVDPGFGLLETADGWVPAEDERLHFIVANVSNNKITIQPGDAIASMQFSTLEGVADGIEVRSREHVESEFLTPGAGELGLAFFTTLATMEQKVDSNSKQLKRMEQAHEALGTEQSSVRQIVDNVNSQTQTVVLFGVYLLLVTIIGLTLSTTVSALSNSNLEIEGWRGIALFIITGLVLLLYAVLFMTIVLNRSALATGILSRFKKVVKSK